ncbi:hypothetical protein B0A48_04107 [Cryoendolithus antarcticus]|uniref:ATP-grasp domain-containing protein n=1 Tax=Cryoendolithus antarcticus TaxID=1507870 RepID=A0A1V8THE3_9PEZI|nr:hypothetical protein B0A48_04107 [Cryoendolithus antarcticus]
MAGDKIYALIDYEDTYVQPLLVQAFKAALPPEILVLINDLSEVPTPDCKVLQWRQYESIDWDVLAEYPNTSLANSYMIRKALIRKHYLTNTVSHWLSKHPDSSLKKHVKPSVDFEVDYAEFLDDALVEAYELRDSWERNAAAEVIGKPLEWWILKPGMSERGQGIRLFSSEQELTEIFEAWDPASDDEDEDDDEATSQPSSPSQVDSPNGKLNNESDNIMTSHLRHFIAQPYIHPPLLLPPPHPTANLKFHIRTYVLATGALKVYVYRSMLALFASTPYALPTTSATNDLTAHLTNTCLQPSPPPSTSVQLFSSLPATMPNLPDTWKDDVLTQICTTTSQVFEAAARTQSVHFQTLPNNFEIFGLDFLVDAEGVAWLLEVNAFPDFGQSGAGEGRELVEGLIEAVVIVGVVPFFGVKGRGGGKGRGKGKETMVEVLDLDLGRR